MVVNKKHLQLTERQKKVFTTEYRVFCKALESLGYQKPSETAVSVDMVQEDLENPKRVSLETVLHQDRYEFFSRTGYSVVLHPGIIDNTFGKRLPVFILIRNENKKQVWSRQFHRLNIQGFFTVLTAYAQAAKNAVDARATHGPRMNYMNLIERSITYHEWELGKASRSFDIRFSTDDSMSSSEIKAIFNKEYARKKYFEKYRTAKQYMRDIRKKWKKG